MGRAEARKFIEVSLSENKVVVFSKSYCSYCGMAKNVLDSLKVDYKVIELDHRDDCEDVQIELKTITGAKTVPRVFINGKFVGGGTEMKQMKANGQLKQLLKA